MNRAQRKALHEVYAKLPKLQCKGLCSESCGPIGVSQAEFDIFAERMGEEPVHAQMGDGTVMIPDGPRGCCPALTHNGHCSMYSDRPAVCRLWGVVETMKCPHGCVPEGGHMRDADGMRWFAEALHAGGAVDHRQAVDEAMKDPTQAGRRFVNRDLQEAVRRRGRV